MPSRHRVAQGDCIESLAAQFGFCWQTIWNHDANAPLRDSRSGPNVLYPGDTVHIPAPQPKEVDCPTDAVHRFCVKGKVTRFRVRLMSLETPRANQEYRLDVDGRLLSGVTDADGWVEQRIRSDARHAVLLLGPGESYSIDLGHLDPVGTVSGVQGRLLNLGFYAGPVSGTSGPDTENAIRAFQRHKGLEETGVPDSATRDALEESHKS